MLVSIKSSPQITVGTMKDDIWYQAKDGEFMYKTGPKVIIICTNVHLQRMKVYSHAVLLQEYELIEYHGEIVITCP